MVLRVQCEFDAHQGVRAEKLVNVVQEVFRQDIVQHCLRMVAVVKWAIQSGNGQPI